MGKGIIMRYSGGGVDTSSLTATALDVRKEKIAYVKGSDTPTVGTMSEKNAATYTPGTTNQMISANQYLSGTQTIVGDVNLIPENIIKGKHIFGKNGTADWVKNIKKKETINLGIKLPFNTEIEVFRRSFKSLGVESGSHILTFVQYEYSTSISNAYNSFFIPSNAGVDCDLVAQYNNIYIDVITHSISKEGDEFVFRISRLGITDYEITINSATVRILSATSITFASYGF